MDAFQGSMVDWSRIWSVIWSKRNSLVFLMRAAEWKGDRRLNACYITVGSRKKKGNKLEMAGTGKLQRSFVIRRATQVALMVKNLAANTGDPRHVGLIHGLGRCPGVGNGTGSGILAWKIP